MNRELIEQYARRQDCIGALTDYDGMGRCIEPGCGDVLEFTMKAMREIVTELRYTITETACQPMRACAQIAVELAMGKPVLEAYLITAAQIADIAGGLDKENIHCAMMAEIALKQTMVNYANGKLNTEL